MPVRINLKELFGSDSQINTVDKLNFNLRDQFAEKYSYHNLCMHYYNLFSNLTEVKNG